MSSLLQHVKVLEFRSIGPVPWAVSRLAEMGAQVTCVVRPGDVVDPYHPIFSARRRFVELDLKSPDARRSLEGLISNHHVLVEGMRPGVMERLGLSPQVCKALNPRIVYARLSGWGSVGPLADKAGHDINYLALTGGLHAIGNKKKPAIPLNIIGDYGGGGSNLIVGILGGLLKVQETGVGVVVDIPMFEGVFKQLAFVFYNYRRGNWLDKRESNAFDGGRPWYRIYSTRCGKFMAVGAIEDKFYSALVTGLGLDISALPDRNNSSNWDNLAAVFSHAFKQKSREDWCAVFDHVDACVTPVLSLEEALQHPHNRAAGIFTDDAYGNVLIKNTPSWSEL